MYRYGLILTFGNELIMSTNLKAFISSIIIEKPLMFAFNLKNFDHVWFSSLEKAACIDIDLFGRLALLNIGNALIISTYTKAWLAHC